MNRRLTFNPRRGIKHFRAPSRVFWKTVRGMLSYKTKRGAAALGILIIIKQNILQYIFFIFLIFIIFIERLKAFEGIPAPYDTR
mgnify:CR=1 FL=1